MSKPPDTSCYRDRRHKEERHEDEKPEVVSSGHTVAHQHLKHQQQDVEPHCNQHGFELHTSLPFGPDRGKFKTSEGSSRPKLLNLKVQFHRAHFHHLESWIKTWLQTNKAQMSMCKMVYLYWGLWAQTPVPTEAPIMTNSFHSHIGVKTAQ